MPALLSIHHRVGRPVFALPAEPAAAVPSPSVAAQVTPAPMMTADPVVGDGIVSAPSPGAAPGGRQLAGGREQQIRSRIDASLPGQSAIDVAGSPAVAAAPVVTAPVEAAEPSPPLVGERVARGAHAYRGSSTRRGPGGGNLACASAVNNVLRRQGVRPLGENPNYVPSMEQDLQQRVRQGAAVRVPPGQARPGDIVIAGNQSHVGIALGGGRVLSNSSSRRSFSWESNINFDGSYGGGASRVYRLVK